MNPETKAERKKEHDRLYVARPDVKEHKKEYDEIYYSKPEVIKHRKEYNDEYYMKEEVIRRRKEYAKEYNQRPDVKARREAYQKTDEYKRKKHEHQKLIRALPESIEHSRDYSKQYLARPEIKQKRKKYYLDNKHRKKELDLKKLYNLTIEEYEALILKQNNKCEICHKEFDTTQPRSICVDHDHNTNQVRGLLCQYCNFTIGLAKEDEKILQNAIEYLRVKTI